MNIDYIINKLEKFNYKLNDNSFKFINKLNPVIGSTDATTEPSIDSTIHPITATIRPTTASTIRPRP